MLCVIARSIFAPIGLAVQECVWATVVAEQAPLITPPHREFAQSGRADRPSFGASLGSRHCVSLSDLSSMSKRPFRRRAGRYGQGERLANTCDPTDWRCHQNPWDLVGVINGLPCGRGQGGVATLLMGEMSTSSSHLNPKFGSLFSGRSV